MLNPKISIIIPVYNSEQYLNKCLDSILNQNYKNFEVVLINDGSKDRSGQICDEYASRDSRFNVYHIENGGVSNARNLGLSIVQGDYVTFVDSDDYLKQDFLFILSSYTEKSFDFIQTGLLFFDENTSLISTEELPDQEFDLKSNKLDAFELATIRLITSPCCKLYKRSIIMDNDLRFDITKSYGEDRDFNIRYLHYVQHAVALSYVGYHYRKGIVTSLSQDKDYEKLFMIDLDYWQKLYDFLLKRECSKEAELYLTTRLYHFYNDRLTQIISSNHMSFVKAYCYISKVKKLEQFKWLYRHITQIKVPTFMYLTYRYKLTLLSAFLYSKYRNKFELKIW